jgi:hypothetical protein
MCLKAGFAAVEVAVGIRAGGNADEDGRSASHVLCGRTDAGDAPAAGAALWLRSVPYLCTQRTVAPDPSETVYRSRLLRTTTSGAHIASGLFRVSSDPIEGKVKARHDESDCLLRPALSHGKAYRLFLRL